LKSGKDMDKFYQLFGSSLKQVAALQVTDPEFLGHLEKFLLSPKHKHRLFNNTSPMLMYSYFVDWNWQSK
jgi:hypothetical protein